VAEVVVSFAAGMQMVSGDTLNFFLPGLTIASSPSTLQVAVRHGAVSALLTASWREADGRLSIPVTVTLPRDTTIRVTVAASVGMRLPPTGVRENDAAFRTKVAAVAGDVARSFDTVQAVGFLGPNTFVSFSLSADGILSPAEITLGIQPVMPIAAGETITWTLPGFSGPPEPFTVSVALEETSPRFSWQASWSQAAHELVVTAPGDVVPIADINIIVPPAAELRLPAAGVRVIPPCPKPRTAIPLFPKPRTPNPESHTLNPGPETPNPQTRDPRPQNPQPQTPKPQTRMQVDSGVVVKCNAALGPVVLTDVVAVEPVGSVLVDSLASGALTFSPAKVLPRERDLY